MSDNNSNYTQNTSISNHSIKRKIPRKLNCSQFISIKRLKSQNNSSSQSTVYTSSIYRNLSIMINRDKEKNKNKNDKNKNKKLYFKDIGGRKKLKNEYEDDDEYYDEDNILEKQKELYSVENIGKLQEEFIEMDLIVNNDKNNNKNTNSIFSTQISRKLPPEALKQPNFKAFKGNPYYLKAIESKIKNIVEFDTDFGNKANYAEDAQNEFDSHFRKQREKEEKSQKEIEKL